MSVKIEDPHNVSARTDQELIILMKRLMEMKSRNELDADGISQLDAVGKEVAKRNL